MLRLRMATRRMVSYFTLAQRKRSFVPPSLYMGDVATNFTLMGIEMRPPQRVMFKSTSQNARAPIRGATTTGKGDCKKESIPKRATVKEQSALSKISNRLFSMIPGKGDCKNQESSKCAKCPPPKKTSSSECCPHPPPKCSSVCGGSSSDTKPRCPAPQRPPQPCNCPFTLEVKHKPGQCPGPCSKSVKC